MVDNQRNTQWAVDFFYPLQKALDLHNISEMPTIIKTHEFKKMRFKRTLRCHISVLYAKMEDEAHGYFVFSREPISKVFFLSMVLNKKLFEDNSHELKVQRNATAVHEFIHCLAALMSVSAIDIDIDSLVEELTAIMKKKQRNKTASKDILAVIDLLSSKLANNNEIPDILTHAHFETGYEDFTGDYADLYVEALLPYNLFIEIFEQEIKAFFKYLEKKDKRSCSAILVSMINELKEKEALDHNFALAQVSKYLLRYSTKK